MAHLDSLSDPMRSLVSLLGNRSLNSGEMDLKMSSKLNQKDVVGLVQFDGRASTVSP